MARGVDQVKNIFFSVLCAVNGADCLGFNGNSTLPLQVHVIEYLRLHFTAGQKAGHLDDAVCQSGFAVVNMGDDTEITDLALVH